MGCCICRIIWDELTEYSQGKTLTRTIQKRLRSPNDPDQRFNLTQVNGDSQQQSSFVRAFLSHVHDQRGLYLLDFRLADLDSKRLATFLLEQTRNESESEIYTPRTDSTDSAEVLQLARFWLHRCSGPEHPECPDETFGGRPRQYPTRLVELPPYGQGMHTLSSLSQVKQGKDHQQEPEDEYVRLVPTKGHVIRPVQIEEPNINSHHNDDEPEAKKPDPKQEHNHQGALPNKDAPNENVPPATTPPANAPSANAPPAIAPETTTSATTTPATTTSPATTPPATAPTANKPTSNSDGSQKGADSANTPKNKDPQGEYVTLSHCWGKQKIPVLMTYNKKAFEKGIRIRDLPLTFQQAINFARRLSRSVRYIWIDALCIIQDSTEDWKAESGKMYDVYRNSYCNLSATKAKDDTEGLHSRRDPHLLWEDEINLNTEGIYRPFAESERKSRLGLEPLIQRCTVRNALFWHREVDDAVVNQRGWVLQERLLAPRVLHFCKDQLAWECGHLDAAECLPHGISTMELKAGKAKERTRLKRLVTEQYGRRGPASNAVNDSYVAHENWKHIVERYSITALTQDGDKLIALAGIAEMMSNRIGKKMIYVAGMWERFLASQLLWRVRPRYEEGMLKHPQRRVLDPWAAPTFSWASIDAAQGISCGETLKEDKLLISVESIHVEPTMPAKVYGLINQGCFIRIRCYLRPIHIEEAPGSPRDVESEDDEKSVRYTWTLEEDDEVTTNMKLSILYMDSPRDDFDDIRDRGQTYCIPAYEKPGDGLICLLVQRNKKAGNKEAENKDAGDKDTGTKDTGTKDTATKHTGDKHTGSKEAGSKEAGSKEAGDKEAGDKDTGNKDTSTKDTGTKDTGRKETGNKEDGTESFKRIGLAVVPEFEKTESAKRLIKDARTREKQQKICLE